MQQSDALAVLLADLSLFWPQAGQCWPSKHLPAFAQCVVGSDCLTSYLVYLFESKHVPADDLQAGSGASKASCMLGISLLSIGMMCGGQFP